MRYILPLLLLFAATSTQASQERLALVIGNAAYQHASPLVNTLNDARDVANDLRAVGFEVTEVENANLNRLIDAVDRFVGDLHTKGGVGLLYYSGHGVQINGRNYLVPVDAQLKRKSRVKYEAYALGDALSRMGGRGAGAINLVILDACRDNPFSAARSAGSKGLARVEAPESTLILYATKPGKTASDNPEGRNGLFTKHLRKALHERGVDVESAFTGVVQGVYQDSEKEQYPWKEGVLLSRFYFVPAPPSAPGAVPIPRGAIVVGPDPEVLVWQACVKSGNEACYRAYLGQYPQGRFAATAGAILGTAVPAALFPPLPVAPEPVAIEQRLGLDRDERKKIQEALNALGHDVGGADGIWGRKTRDGIATWQRGAGREATGYLTAEGYKGLLGQVRVEQSRRAREPRAGQGWRDPVTGMEFVWVPKGC